MSLISLVLSNLRYYRKPYLLILAGTVISTAVLTGALVVGDSVRYSLEQLTEIRLGKSRFAVQAGDRFFRQQLASELSDKTKRLVAPLLQLEGIAVNNDLNTRINRVEVLGIDERFIKFWNSGTQQPAEDEAILSRNSAEKLKLKPGDEFVLKLHKKAKASENAPFVSEKEPLVALRLKVSAIADDMLMGRFSLKSNQSAPFTIFISLPSMSRKAELEDNANLMLVEGNANDDLSPGKLDSLLRLSWQPDDAGLGFKSLPGTKTFEIRSDRIFIDDNTADAIKKAIPGAKPVFTYLVNDISSKGKSTPYSFVTAANPDGIQLSEKEIIISNWLAADLSVKPGDSIQLKYYRMGALRKLTEDSSRFYIKTVLPISNPVFDPTLMPDFPGMSEAGNCRDWETGAPVDLGKIRDKDEQYWNNYRGTPKAFIAPAAGKKLWDNAFGHATAFRFEADSSDLKNLQTVLMSHLNPAENGLRFQDVLAEGKLAATNSTDFGGLFLSLSFFIIAGALLLTALLFSLHAQKRMVETAILATLGFRKKQIIRIFFFEAALVVITGGITGTVCGIFYNKLMLLGLNSLWQDAVRTSMLQVHLMPGTLFTGFAAGVLTALLTLLFVLLRNRRKPISVLVKGVEITSPEAKKSNKNVSLAISITCFAFAFALTVFSFVSPGSELPLAAGGMLLTGAIALLYMILVNSGLKLSDSLPGFYTMILRNVSLKKRRTVTAIALLAIGTFSVLITGANRKTYYGSETSSQSGTGGFLFWAESAVPVLNDLNSPQGKEKYNLTDEKDLEGVMFVQMLGLDGDDASCLNLNQVSQPKILGINPMLFDRQQAFSFEQLDASIAGKHPWLALNEPLSPGIIPAFVDQTVITWGLRKKIGDTLLYTDEKGRPLKVKIIGGLASSIFQGNILISEELLRHYFPSAGGSEVILLKGDFVKRNEIQERIEYLFQDYGMVVTPTSARLAEFNTVTNTYLTVFMMLGGLGIIIGTIGLGVVLLRNLDERKSEIALYQGIGFSRSFIRKLIFAENLFILLAGMGTGIVSAFAGILPTLLSPAFQVPAIFLSVIILLIFTNGMAWIYFPARSALRNNVVQTLRKE